MGKLHTTYLLAAIASSFKYPLNFVRSIPSDASEINGSLTLHPFSTDTSSRCGTESKSVRGLRPLGNEMPVTPRPGGPESPSSVLFGLNLSPFLDLSVYPRGLGAGVMT